MGRKYSTVVITPTILVISVMLGVVTTALWYSSTSSFPTQPKQQQQQQPVMNQTIHVEATRDPFYDPINNPYFPPVRLALPSYGNYRQVGILTPVIVNNGMDPIILPLMARPLRLSRDKWHYYSMNTQGTFSTKLPIRIGGKICNIDYGCDGVSSGDIVNVEGYNNTDFTVTMYESGFF